MTPPTGRRNCPHMPKSVRLSADRYARLCILMLAPMINESLSTAGQFSLRVNTDCSNPLGQCRSTAVLTSSLRHHVCMSAYQDYYCQPDVPVANT